MAEAGDRSPFAIAAKSAAIAVVRNAKAQIDDLESNLDTIFTDIYNHFGGMIATAVVSPAEQQAKDAVKQFMVQAKLEFTKVQQDLEKVKAKYNHSGDHAI